MKKLIASLPFLFCLPVWATATLSTHLVHIDTSPAVHRNFVRLDLRGCAGSIPNVPGFGAATLTQDFSPDGSGLVTSTIFDNNQIQCNGRINSTYYVVTIYDNGVPSSTGSYFVISSTTFDPTTTPPLQGIPSGGGDLDASLQNLQVFQQLTGFQASFDAVSTCQLNTDYFVGSKCFPTTIQSAVTVACANAAYSNKGRVVIPVGITPGDVATDVTGCTGVVITDYSATPWACYSSTGGLYTSNNCASGGGGGGSINTITAASPLGGGGSSSTVNLNCPLCAVMDGSSPSVQGVALVTESTTNTLLLSRFILGITDDTIRTRDSGPIVAIEPLTAPAVNTVINAGSSLSIAITACGSANTTIQITQTIAVGSGITVPVNCTLLFQSAGNLTGTSITINGPIQAARRQIIGAGLAVTLGPITTEAPIEWFGGKADATGSVGVGTDNLAPFNLAHNALSAGCIEFAGASGYRFSGTPTISKVSICLEGQTVGYPPTAAGIQANSTNLFIDSASADGPTFASTATWGIIRNLAVLRTQTPTGTAKGVSISASGVVFENVTSEDSIYPAYYHGANSFATGYTANVSVGWGFTGMAGTPTPNVCGFFVDDSGGLESASIRFFHDTAGSNLAGAGFTTGLCAVGTNISDLYINHLETAGTNIGIDLENTGTTNFVSQDIQIVDSILNTCLNDCLKINGIGSTLDTGPHVFITGGNFFATGTAAIGAFIENSSNVSMTNVQLFTGAVNSQTDISLSSVDGFQINDNQMDGASLVNISCLNSTHGTINGNQIKTGGTATGIKNVGCTNVSEQGNSIAGNNGVALTTGMSFDSGSSNNGPWSLNAIDSATVTTPVSDAGTGNNTLKPTVIVLNSGTPLTGQSSAQSQIVTCPTGGTSTQYCGADGAWHAASGTGFANPMTGVGDFIYGGTAGVATRLASPTVAGTYNLCETPTGSAVAPTWCNSPITLAAVSGQLLNSYNAVTGAFTQRFLVSGDIPNNAANTSGNAATATALASLPTQCSGGTTLATGVAASGNANCTGSIGAATGTSLLVTGNLDGTAPVTVTTGSTATLGGTFKSGYTFNNEGTTSTAVTYTLPAAAAGLQYCIANLPTETGALTLQTSGTGQFIGRVGAYGTTGGHAASAGALGDSACIVGIDSTHWLLYPQSGTWTNP
jgi:hypothetical protein